MKVIDILNKIANGEQPSHIRVYGRDWYWNNYDGYVTKSSLSTTPDAQNYLFNSYRLDFALDKEVEIIEEPKEELEEIDVLTYDEDCTCEWKFEELYQMCEKLIANQNKIIREFKANNKQ